jgi:Cu(I)/Ag(I) efflux system membrane fusion protein
MKFSVMKWPVVVAIIVVSVAAGWYLGKGGPQQQETAFEHAAKHLDSKYQCPMHPSIVKDKPGNCPICGMELRTIKEDKPAAKKEQKLLYWVAPMDPNYRRDKPGKSPMGMDLVAVYDDGGVEDNDEAGPVVRISAAVENNLGVRTAVVKSGKLWRKIDTVGYVSFDESRVSHIHLRVDGWIENLAVDVEGERVKKGQRLFDLYSPKLVNAMEEYVQALKISNPRLLRASTEKLVALGVSRRQINKLKKDQHVPRTISIYAPQKGVVSMLMAREGMYVQPANSMMTLADLSTVWVLAEVFESQSEWVKLGQSVDVELAYIPGRTWKGSVDYIYPSLNANNRTLKVRLRFDNPDEILKPNMYANVSIYGGGKDNVLSVPREALIRTGKNQRLIIAKGAGRFAQRMVVAGMESGDWVEIKAGIKAGEKVVISAQFLLDSEASMKASLLRMSGPEAEANGAGPVTARGIITRLMMDHGMISVRHEPIESLAWPAMTMDFNTQKGVSLQGLAVGDQVEFELLQSADGYMVSAIRKQGE